MDNKKSTLLILTPGFAADKADSSCLPFMQQFIRSLNLQYPSLHIVVIAFDYPFTRKTYDWNSNTIYSINGYRKSGFLKILKWYRAWKKLNQVNKTHAVIGLLSFWCGECAYIGNRYAKGKGLLHFCWLLGQDARKSNRYINRIKPLPSNLVAISDFINHEFEKNYGIAPAYTIPVGIDVSQFPEEKYTRDIDVMAAGSLIPLKQYHVFIEIIKMLKADNPGIKAILCGKGPQEKELLELIEIYGLQNNIRLTGELLHQDILRYMKKSKCFLHTSNYEGFSAVCLEASYAGTPVISFCKPMDEMMEYWHIVADKKEMLEKTKYVLNNTSPAPYPSAPFSTRKAVQKIMQLYNYREQAID